MDGPYSDLIQINKPLKKFSETKKLEYFHDIKNYFFKLDNNIVVKFFKSLYKDMYQNKYE